MVTDENPAASSDPSPNTQDDKSEDVTASIEPQEGKSGDMADEPATDENPADSE